MKIFRRSLAALLSILLVAMSTPIVSTADTYEDFVDQAGSIYDSIMGDKSNGQFNIGDVPEGAVTWNGHWYYAYQINSIANWQAAQDYCESKNGYLATITSEEENQFVFSHLRSTFGYENAYIGLTDKETEGTWEWVTGEAVSYTNFHPHEPNAETAAEDYAMFYYKYSDGVWNDGDFGGRTVNGGNVFLCEWGEYTTIDQDIVLEEEYIRAHVAFQNWFSPSEEKQTYSFYNNIWAHEMDTHQSHFIGNRLAAYRAWDIIGDAGKVCSFDVGDLTLYADYYDLFLSDLILAVNSTYVGEKTASRALEIYGECSNSFKEVFENTENWKEHIAGNDALKYELENLFSNPNHKISEELDDILEDIIEYVFLSEGEKIVKKFFDTFDEVNEIFTYITTANDIVGAFGTVLKTYAVTKSYQEVNAEFFTIMYRAADKMENQTYATWFRNALDDYKAMSMSNTALYECCKSIIIESAKITHDTLCQEMISNTTYKYLTTKFGLPPSTFGVATLTYNVTYTLLDAISGLSKEAVPYYSMNYVAPLEKALCEVESEYAQKLQSAQTYENAVNYDLAYNLLKQTNLYLYQCAYNFSAEKSIEEDMDLILIYHDFWSKIQCHNSENVILSNKKCITVQCPVDVYVYDESGNIALLIVEEEIIQIEPLITALVFAGKKTFIYPADKNYTIKIVARSDGSMQYAVSEIQGDSNVRDVEFYNLPLTKKAAYTGELPYEFGLENAKYALTTDETVVSCQYDSLNPLCEANEHTFENWTVLHETDPIDGVEISYCSRCGFQAMRLLLAEPDQTLLGDINFDGRVDSSDARVVLQTAVGKTHLTAIETAVADTDSNGKIDSSDARLILQAAVGKADLSTVAA